MDENGPDHPFRSTTHPRRVSSSPDLRESVHITAPASAYFSPHDRGPSVLRGNSPIAPLSTLPSLEAGAELDAHPLAVEESQTHSTTAGRDSVERPQTESIGRIDNSDPLPSWDDYPPLPRVPGAGVLSFGRWWTILKTCVGYEGPKERREVVKLSWKLSFDLVQIVTSIVFLVLSAHLKSPVSPNLTEWTACTRPLGVWVSLWVVRIGFGAFISLWAFQRQRLSRKIERQTANSSDAEARPQSPNLDGDTMHEMRLENDVPPAESIVIREGNTSNTPRLPHSNTYTRFSLLVSLFSLTWWCTAHIFLYTSVKTCRLTSPHLWWMAFGLIAIGYFIIVEVFIVAMVIFIIGPMTLLILNGFLLCLGRPPIRPPTRIRPAVSKLPKETVARIPLVLYIPSPSPAYLDEQLEKSTQDHTYPPGIHADSKPRIVDEPPKSSVFKLFSRSSGFNLSSVVKREKKSSDTWEDQWEKGSYPLVRLSGTRATCHICLEEFEEPKRKIHSTEKRHKSIPDSDKPKNKKHGWFKDRTNRLGEDPLRLEDAGSGAQPLRLLACGHVFHRTCIDPWLIDVSGRCPVCQRPVELDGARGRNEAPSSRRLASLTQGPPRNAETGEMEDGLDGL